MNTTARRAPAFQVEVLTTRDCADWMGYSTQWVRQAITRGVTAADGRTLKLAADAMSLTARRPTFRVYRDDFITFLTAIGWKRIPGQHARAETQGAPRPTIGKCFPPGNNFDQRFENSAVQRPRSDRAIAPRFSK
jgi:hypothetical protein